MSRVIARKNYHWGNVICFFCLFASSVFLFSFKTKCTYQVNESVMNSAKLFLFPFTFWSKSHCLYTDCQFLFSVWECLRARRSSGLWRSKCNSPDDQVRLNWNKHETSVLTVNFPIISIYLKPVGYKTRQICYLVQKHVLYRRIPKVTGPITFGFSRQKGLLLSGNRYLRVVVTFGCLKNVNLYSNSPFRQSRCVTEEIEHKQSRLYRQKR